MKSQPDTSTLEGKIAVMEASKTCRIQGCSYKNGWHEWRDYKFPLWEWDTFQYRIHPDDLNPPEKPKYRPWTKDEVPVGRTVTNKETFEKFLICGFLVDNFVHILIGNEYYLSGHVLAKFVMEDGSPCGVKL